MKEPHEQPQDSWTLDRLADFVRRGLRLKAVEGWWIGRALLIAETKLKEKKAFDAWVAKEIGVGRTTAWRYRKIADAFTHDEMQSTTLAEVYGRLELVKAPHDECEDQGVTSTLSPEPTSNDEQLPHSSMPSIAARAPEPQRRIEAIHDAPGPNESEGMESLPIWAKGPADRLHDDNEFDVLVECDKFVQSLDVCRAERAWAFSDEDYIERVKTSLNGVTDAIAAVLADMESTEAV